MSKHPIQQLTSREKFLGFIVCIILATILGYHYGEHAKQSNPVPVTETSVQQSQLPAPVSGLQ